MKLAQWNQKPVYLFVFDFIRCNVESFHRETLLNCVQGQEKYFSTWRRRSSCNNKSRETCVLAEKRQNRFIFESFPINPNPKSFTKLWNRILPTTLSQPWSIGLGFWDLGTHLAARGVVPLPRAVGKVVRSAIKFRLVSVCAFLQDGRHRNTTDL